MNDSITIKFKGLICILEPLLNLLIKTLPFSNAFKFCPPKTDEHERNKLINNLI
jgi:hypothetical protein